VSIVRFIGIRQAQAVVSKDTQAYNEVWERELEHDQGHTALNRLDLVVKSLEQDIVRKDDDMQTSGKLQHIGRKFFYINGGRRLNIPQTLNQSCSKSAGNSLNVDGARGPTVQQTLNHGPGP
jgi:hypothetical protein